MDLEVRLSIHRFLGTMHPLALRSLYDPSMDGYTKAISGDTNRDVDIERRQWFSGQAFLSELLGACLKGTKLKGSNHVLVKDFTMYNAELAKHAIAQNSTTGQPAGLATLPSRALAPPATRRPWRRMSRALGRRR